MSIKNKIFVLVPLYNEGDICIANIKEIIGKIENHNCEIVIIDDGSCDGSEVSLKNARFPYFVKIISHKKNLGLGKVFQSFFKYVFESIKEKDIVIITEGDGTCDVNLLNRMVEIIDSGVDVVIASRKCFGGKDISTVTVRKYLTTFSNIILRAALQFKHIKDITIFYRAYSGAILNKANKIFGKDLFWGEGFVINTDLLYKLKCINASICEIPHLYNRTRKVSKSKLKLCFTIYEYIVYIAKIQLENIFKKQYL